MKQVDIMILDLPVSTFHMSWWISVSSRLLQEELTKDKHQNVAVLCHCICSGLGYRATELFAM